MPQRRLSGAGTQIVGKPAERIKAILLDPGALLSLVPAASTVEQTGPGAYRGELTFRLGPIQGRYAITLTVDEPQPLSFTLAGTSQGRFGQGEATAALALREIDAGHTHITWRYDGVISGAIGLIGNRIQRLAARGFIHQFFAALETYD